MKSLVQKVSEHKWYVVWLIAFTLVSICRLSAGAQNVVQRGKEFVEVVDSTKKSGAKQSEFNYRDKDGKKYPIYISDRGNCYILKTSKNGKVYRKYLPDVAKKLNLKK